MGNRSIKPLFRGYLFLLILIIQLVSCKDKEENISAIRYRETALEIRYLQYAENNNFVCIGVNPTTNEYKGYKFDRQLNFIKEIRFKDLKGFNGDLHFKSLGEEGWIVSNLVNEGLKAVLTIYKTDVNFNIIKSITLMNRSRANINNKRGIVQDIQYLKNGDYAIIWEERLMDNYYYILEAGIRITRLSPDLDLLWSFDGSELNVPDYRSPNSLTSVELPNGNIVYSHALFGGPAPRRLNLVYGMLTPQGELVYQEFKTGEAYGTPWSMYASDNGEVIVKTVSNEDLLSDLVDNYNLFFVKFDASNGTLLGSASVPENIRDANYSKSTNIQKGLRLFYYAADVNKFVWGALDEKLEINNIFYPTLPYLETHYGVCQLATKEKTILMAVTFQYKGQKVFELMEFTELGELVSKKK